MTHHLPNRQFRLRGTEDQNAVFARFRDPDIGEFGQVGLDGCVEVDEPFVNKDQESGANDPFGHRGNPKDTVHRHRFGAFDIGPADRFGR